MSKFHLLLLSLAALFSACEQSSELPIKDSTPSVQQSLAPADIKPPLKEQRLVKAVIGSDFSVSESPDAQSYRAKLKANLSSTQPVLLLNGLDDPKQLEAQALFLKLKNLDHYFYSDAGEPLRNEVMNVQPLLASDLIGSAKDCQPGQCYRINLYNFFFNVTLSGVVDVVNKRILRSNEQRESQPDLSHRLEQLARSIAAFEPMVQEELRQYSNANGVAAESLEAVMTSTKTALNNTLCERSRHLCVAPTYVLGEQALWVIVDLTDFKVAGIRWTHLGQGAQNQIVTERRLENEYVFENYCEKSTALERNGWSMEYHLTTSDGLRVAGIRFNDRPVLASAKVVDWHVSYSRADGFGYSDATGCPMFSSAVVVAFEGPRVTPIIEEGVEVGFSLTQDFRQLPWPAPCAYRYNERYEFYNDGRYRVAVSNLGRGCGDSGTYRPILRLEMPSLPQQSTFAMQRFRAGEWRSVDNEEWSSQPEKDDLFENKFSHRYLDVNGYGYMMAPSRGQFGDGGRGDRAFIYTTVNHSDLDEGQTDLVTLGSCCNKDYQQGPELFMQPPESVLGQPLVLWYVPQMKNDSSGDAPYCWSETIIVDGVAQVKTWPCTAGPMFTPIGTGI